MKKRDVYQYHHIVRDLFPILEKIIANPDIEGIDYKGLEVTTPSVTGVVGNIKHNLSEKGLAYHRSNGRTALHVIFMEIYHMGFQQGEAKMIEDYGDMFDLMKRINDKGGFQNLEKKE